MNTQKRLTGQHSDMFLHRHDRFSGNFQYKQNGTHRGQEKGLFNF